MPKIVVNFKNKVLEELTLGDQKITIGRCSTSDIVLDNLGVSRHHAKIYKLRGDFVIVDLNSQNGVIVNKEKVTYHKLKDQDTIEIGKHALIFRDEDIFKQVKPMPFNDVCDGVFRDAEAPGDPPI